MLNHDTYVYSVNIMPTLGSSCLSVFMLIQSSRAGKEEKSKRENLNQRSLYASLNKQPLLLSISRYPSSAYGMNMCICTILYKYINKGERRERLPTQTGEARNFVWLLSRITGSREMFLFL